MDFRTTSGLSADRCLDIKTTSMKPMMMDAHAKAFMLKLKLMQLLILILTPAMILCGVPLGLLLGSGGAALRLANWSDAW